MANKFEKMSLENLLIEVKNYGVPTDAESVVAIQDVIAHAGTEALVDAVNNNKTRDTVYFVLFHVWHWEEATRFFNEHSNLNYIKYKNEAQKKAKLEKELAEAHDKYAAAVEQLNKIGADYIDLKIRAEGMAQEILVLKARLYDFMVEKEKKG